jgi:hypothetical protein
MMPLFRRRAAFLAVVVSFVLPASARADDKRILVLPFSGSVPGTPDGPARLTKVVARAAGLTGGDVVMGQATFADATTLVGCSTETADCFAQLAASMGVQEVVIGDVQPVPGGTDVAITMKFFQNGEVRDASLKLPAGDMDKLVARRAREASKLFVPDGEEAPPPPAEPPPPAPAPTPAPTPLTSAPPRDDGGGARHGIGVLPWVLVGSGVVLAGAGGAFLYLGGKRQDDVDGAPIHDADDFDRLVELEDEGDRYFKIGTGLAIAGGAVMATGAVLAIVRRMRDHGDGGGEQESAVSVGVVPAGDGLGVGLSWRTP